MEFACTSPSRSDGGPHEEPLGDEMRWWGFLLSAAGLSDRFPVKDRCVNAIGNGAGRSELYPTDHHPRRFNSATPFPHSNVNQRL